GLDRRFAEMLVLGVEQAAIRSPDTERPERLLEVVGLQEDSEAGDRAFDDGSAGKRGQRGPEMLLDLGGDRDALAHQDRDDPVGGPGAFGDMVNASERLQRDP